MDNKLRCLICGAEDDIYGIVWTNCEHRWMESGNFYSGSSFWYGNYLIRIEFDKQQLGICGYQIDFHFTYDQILNDPKLLTNKLDLIITFE